MKPTGQFTSIGGQAVIEGVMMRSPHFIAVAVRKPNQKIVIQNAPYLGISFRYPFLRKPVLRGIVALIESMVQGMEALGFSASIASDSEKETQKLSSWAIASSMGIALCLGLGLFVILPHFLAAFLSSPRGFDLTPKSPFFHLLDGCFKLGILLCYVSLIARINDVKRVFQYHGAEHKSIYAFEAGEELTVANAKKYTTLHPRCGTSFLLFLVLISVGIFSIVFPLFGLTALSSVPILNHFGMILIKAILMFPVAGLAYEFIKTCAMKMNNPLFRAMIWPGMVLQRLTTREPTDEQLEVALASLKQVLKSEKSPLMATERSKFEIADLLELGQVHALVTEFPEI